MRENIISEALRQFLFNDNSLLCYVSNDKVASIDFLFLYSSQTMFYRLFSA